LNEARVPYNIENIVKINNYIYENKKYFNKKNLGKIKTSFLYFFKHVFDGKIEKLFPKFSLKKKFTTTNVLYELDELENFSNISEVMPSTNNINYNNGLYDYNFEQFAIIKEDGTREHPVLNNFLEKDYFTDEEKKDIKVLFAFCLLLKTFNDTRDRNSINAEITNIFNLKKARKYIYISPLIDSIVRKTNEEEIQEIKKMYNFTKAYEIIKNKKLHEKKEAIYLFNFVNEIYFQKEIGSEICEKILNLPICSKELLITLSSFFYSKNWRRNANRRTFLKGIIIYYYNILTKYPIEKLEEDSFQRFNLFKNKINSSIKIERGNLFHKSFIVYNSENQQEDTSSSEISLTPVISDEYKTTKFESNIDLSKAIEELLKKESPFGSLPNHTEAQQILMQDTHLGIIGSPGAQGITSNERQRVSEELFRRSMEERNENIRPMIYRPNSDSQRIQVELNGNWEGDEWEGVGEILSTSPTPEEAPSPMQILEIEPIEQNETEPQMRTLVIDI